MPGTKVAQPNSSSLSLATLFSSHRAESAFRVSFPSLITVIQAEEVAPSPRVEVKLTQGGGPANKPGARLIAVGPGDIEAEAGLTKAALREMKAAGSR